MPAIRVKSPGKTILFGEHAVVYGHPAIAVPLPSIGLQASFLGLPDQPSGTVHIRNINTQQEDLLDSLPAESPIKVSIDVTTDFLKISRLPATEISLSSSIPIASGLGSSAALAAALIRGLSLYLGFQLSNQQINELAFEVEKIQHGTPSGIDNSVIVYQQPIYYMKDHPIECLILEKPLTLVVADTGKPSITKEVVSEVRDRLQAQPYVYTPILDQIGRIAKAAKRDLIKGNLVRVGALINENQELLRRLGVSCLELDLLVATALDAGALGAKLCGSGKGGNIVALAPEGKAEAIRDALLADGAVMALIAEIK